MTMPTALHSTPANQHCLAAAVPVYNEAAVLPELLRRLPAALDQVPDCRWIITFVDDGSIDATGELLNRASQLDSRIHVARFSRNFGHQPALSAAIADALSAGADAIITMDADLQDPPELIPELVAAWRAGAEVVLAVRRSRQERGIRRWSMDLFHRVFHHLADFPISAQTGTFGLLNRAASEALCALPERHRFFPGLRDWVGFTKREIIYDRHARAAGEPQQTFRHLVRYAIDGLFSFSYLPLRVLTLTGIGISLCGFILGAYFIIKRLSGVENAVTGFTTLVTLVLFLGGTQLIGIGILGEYLARIYDEVKQRPLYIKRPGDSGALQPHEQPGK